MTTESIASAMNLGLLLSGIGLLAVAAVTALAVGWLERRAEKWAETHPPRDHHWHKGAR